VAGIDRRAFLATGGLALAGLVAACSKRPSGEPPPGGASINDIIGIAADRKDARFTMVQAAEKIPVGANARVPFALVSGDGTKRYTGGAVKVWYATNPDGDAAGPVDAVYHGEGLNEKGVYVVRLNLDKPGNWLVFALGKPVEAPVEAYGGAFFTVVATVAGPAVGAKAISVATPTPQNHRGVEPYCTRTPPCSMHALSLDAALKNGKPTVFNIGTPRFCQSQVCGPVVDVIQSVATSMSDRVNFVHAEVFKDDHDAPAKQILSPAAAAYSLEAEPITYWIRPDATITERIVGPVDTAEVRDITQTLLG
jgi:hypothetical protein